MAPQPIVPARLSAAPTPQRILRTSLRVATALAATLALSACGGTDDAPNAQSTSSTDTATASQLPAEFHATSDAFDYTSSDFSLLDPCEDIPVDLLRDVQLGDDPSSGIFSNDEAKSCTPPSFEKEFHLFLLGANTMDLPSFKERAEVHAAGTYISDPKVHTFMIREDEDDHCGVGSFYSRGHFVVINYPNSINGGEELIRTSCKDAYEMYVKLTQDRRFPK